LRLHNTLTRRKEEFVPLDPANVRMYVCGPTVYDRIHIGNARPFVIFDVLFRLLRREYGAEHVTYARNITDIDDKINNRAKERGIDIAALTVDTTRTFHEDVAALGCLPPTFEPRATGTIAEMQEMIAALIAKGYAYAAEGHVLFDVPAMMERPPLPGHIYGLLSKKNRDDLIAGARVDVAPYKRDPADFVLWKPSTPDLPGWDSPWGRGRPGWHIECSAMARKHLGETFDIHAGGLDLIFPHHENEIAQSECCNGVPMARTWMHNGFIERSGEKMAKSVGNIDKVRDLLDEFPGEALRLMLLKTHYRSPLEFTNEGLREAKAQLDRWYGALRGETADLDDVCKRRSRAFDPVEHGLVKALSDDLNTAEAITWLNREVDDVFRYHDGLEKTDQRRVVCAMGKALGLLQQDPDTWFQRPIVGRLYGTESPDVVRIEGLVGWSEKQINELIEKRKNAREARNFKEADRIRDELAQQGVILEDGPKGTTWRRAG
jgi:cysteinyl-tRNA synthetase